MKKKEKRKYMFILAFALGVTVFIGVTLSEFYADIEQRVYSKQISVTKELSLQGSAVVEKKLEGLVNTLYGLAEYLQEEDMANDANLDRLKEFIEKKNIGFQRIGIADINGNAKVTNGETLNISDRQYFQTCVQEKRGSSEIRNSELVGKPVCIIAVPILQENTNPIGVLYGVVEIEVFNIYDNTILENEEHYIQLVDMEGNYILKEESSLIGKRENIFDGIGSVKSEKSTNEIRKQIQNERQVYTEISDEKNHEIAYFTPLKINDWCVVTVIDYSEITSVVNYILGNDVNVMILKIITVFVLLFLFATYYFWKERKKIQSFNERLMLDEKIVQIAAERTGIVIMSYEIKSKNLRFISNTLFDMEFPEQIDNAPEEFAKYMIKNKELEEQIRKIYFSLEQGEGKKEFYLNFVRNGKEMNLRLQLTSMNDSNGKIQTYIGVLEDYTEELMIRNRADRDSLTGLYNRNRAIEKIEECMSGKEVTPGTVHVFMILDVDNFKVLNDMMGHQVGDKALQDIADVLKHHFRDYDIVCRMGGDEFLVFMKDIPEEAVYRNVSSLLKKLELTYEVRGISVTITVSVGIALVPDLSMDFSEIYRRADEALYQVKKEAKNNFHVYGK